MRSQATVDYFATFVRIGKVTSVLIANNIPNQIINKHALDGAARFPFVFRVVLRCAATTDRKSKSTRKSNTNNGAFLLIVSATFIF